MAVSLGLPENPSADKVFASVENLIRQSCLSSNKINAVSNATFDFQNPIIVWVAQILLLNISNIVFLIWNFNAQCQVFLSSVLSLQKKQCIFHLNRTIDERLVLFCLLSVLPVLLFIRLLLLYHLRHFSCTYCSLLSSHLSVTPGSLRNLLYSINESNHFCLTLTRCRFDSKQITQEGIHISMKKEANKQINK